MEALAVVLALGLALALGMGSAGNATAGIIAARALPERSAFAWSFGFHALGGLVGGTAVAATMQTLVVGLPEADRHRAFAAGSLAAIVFTVLAARRGIPVSATFGVAGGLVGAGLVAGGADAVDWDGRGAPVPGGVLAVVLALVLSPLVGIAAASGLHAALRYGLAGARRTAVPRVRRGVLAASAAVAMAGGANDGQKAMGVGAGAIAATLPSTQIPLWLRVAASLVLAAGTVVAGRRVIRTVARGLYRADTVDALSAQTSGAVAILAAGMVGAPVSTGNVVTAAYVGVGLRRRSRHVRWAAASRVAAMWAAALPAAALIGALAYGGLALLP